MAKRELVVYPRGFLGFDIGLAVNDANDNLDQVVQAIKFNKPLPKKEAVVFNHDVDSLWDDFTKGTRYVTQFKFREKILITALRAFGTDNFEQWCSVQQLSPYFTDMNRRFLNDTFNYIITGQRQLNVQSWVTLVNMREAGTGDREVRLEAANLFDNKATSDNPPVPWDTTSNDYFNKPNVDLTNVLHFWTSKPNGFEDLLATLYILFGSDSS